MLFGVELKPGLQFAHTFVQDTKLTAATLVIKKGASPPGQTVYLKVQVEDGWLPIAALHYGSEENVPLRLYFEEGEVAAFRIEGEGKNFSVGLSGFVVPEPEGGEEDEDEMMMRMMGGEDDESDESDEESDEDISKYSKKDMAALMRKIAGDRMEDDEDGESDEDDESDEDSSFEDVPSDQDEELDSDELCPDVPGVQIEEVDEDEEEEEEEEKPAKKEVKKEKKAEAKEKSQKQKEKEEWDRKLAEKKAKKAEAAAQGQKRGAEAEEEKKPAKKAKKEVKEEKKPEPKRQVQGGVTIEDLNVAPPGKQAKKGSHVKIKYTGRLTNGKVFDSNVRSGKPLAFRIASGEVIPGFDIGVTGMTVGGKRRVSIPPRLGYGSQRIPGIPPNSTLVFDIELVNMR